MAEKVKQIRLIRGLDGLIVGLIDEIEGTVEDEVYNDEEE